MTTRSTKSSKSAGVKAVKPAAGRSATASPASRPAKHAAAPLELPHPGAGMLDAGLKALSQARSRLSEGQEKVVQSLIDPFGIRKLEEVFDQRVASAIERLGLPSAAGYEQLLTRLEEFDERLRKLEAAARKKT